MNNIEDFLLNELKERKKIAGAQRKMKLEEKRREILKATDFSLKIYYRDSVKYSGRELFEEIELEGFDNAETIFNVYREMAFKLKIQKLVMMKEGEKVKGVNFKYNLDK